MQITEEGRIEGRTCEKLSDLVAGHTYPARVSHGDEVCHRPAIDRDTQALTSFDLT